MSLFDVVIFKIVLMCLNPVPTYVMASLDLLHFSVNDELFGDICHMVLHGLMQLPLTN